MFRNEHAGATSSLWMTTQPVDEFPELNRDEVADVAIVGAGIAGLSAAYLLVREGQKVVVLDDGPIISGETERTTAHLASALDDGFSELEKLFGEDGARLAAQSHAAAIDQIESIVRSEAIDCDFARLDGYLFLGSGDSEETLEKELAAARRAGLAVDFVDRVPVSSFNSGRALRFGNQGQFHPLKYLNALARAVARGGGQIFAHTHASKIQDGEPAKIVTESGHSIEARALIVATNTPINDRVTMHTKQAPYRTYVIGAVVPAGPVPQALYWDTLDPYHYVRLQRVGDTKGGHDILIVGGEDHKTGQDHNPGERFERLEAWARERFPIQSVEYRWSGQVIEPVDSLAFIGLNPGEKHVYIATGDSGHGMTHGTIAGMLLRDLILGRQNEWAGIYDPSRKPTRALGEFLKENLNVAKQYKDLLTRGEVADEDEIPSDSGAVISRHGKKFAVYRDAAGQAHECSAVCPHLDCIVAWNSVEKTWDCPCHGSRFDCFGKVLNGPANQDLTKSEAFRKKMAA